MLTPAAQARLDDADSPEKLQALVLDVMNRAGSGMHKYSLSGSGLCALTKSYDDLGYRESVCLEPGRIVNGNNGDIRAIGSGEEAFRKTITLWSLYVQCGTRACAVYTEGTKSEYMDSYFFGTPFADEESSLLAAKALTQLAEACKRD